MCAGNCLCAGDHVSWHTPLDKKEGGLIQHMLLSEDPKLRPLDTPLGTVNFVQVNMMETVSVCVHAALFRSTKWDHWWVYTYILLCLGQQDGYYQCV